MIFLRRTVFFITVICIVFLSSCGPERVPAVTLDPTPPLSGGMGWGVVSVAYARALAEPRPDAEQGTFFRRGELLELTGRTRRNQAPSRGVWYRLRSEEGEGWLHESFVRVFDTKPRAEAYAKEGL